jgi:hypothetical protein
MNTNKNPHTLSSYKLGMWGLLGERHDTRELWQHIPKGIEMSSPHYITLSYNILRKNNILMAACHTTPSPICHHLHSHPIAIPTLPEDIHRYVQATHDATLPISKNLRRVAEASNPRLGSGSPGAPPPRVRYWARLEPLESPTLQHIMYTI